MNEVDLKLITTEDGSHSLYHPQLNETYHSFHGALQESQYVFIKQGLEFWLEKNGASKACIFEMGFGTGLNALLVAYAALISHWDIHYESIERYPIKEELASSLNYPQLLDEKLATNLFQKIHASDWNGLTPIHQGFEIIKISGDITNTPLTKEVDVIFFDAFAPNKQHEVWDISILEKLVEIMSEGGVFVTYCAQGQLKRNLKALGLLVETLPGPPGKKEMVRAIKTSANMV